MRAFCDGVRARGGVAVTELDDLVVLRAVWLMALAAERARAGGAMNGEQRGRGSDLEIVEERVMVAIPRGGEELRFTFTRAKKPDGGETAWHSLRVFWKSAAGDWRPGKQGVSIRGGELGAVAVGLLRACVSRIPVPLHPATKDIVTALLGEPLPHEVYDRRAGREPR
jgi:hypothetical protein